MTNTELGRLDRVDLRAVWHSEAGDFTPWLAQEENLKLLGDAIGLDLELEAQEKGVGSFRADILCKDMATGHWVLVENQLERTDHGHLGQLITYAAGLQAVTVVWVANPFIEEHRAALDWLNAITNEEFNFFGLEVELWRIGGSQPAPKFNVVCKPNDWTRAVGVAVRNVDGGELSGVRLLQLEYWAALRDELVRHGGPIRPRKPLPQAWADFAVGRTGFSLNAFTNTKQPSIGVGLYIWDTPDNKAAFHKLREHRDSIERELGTQLEWQELPDAKSSMVQLIRQGADPARREQWPEQHKWLCEQLAAFHSAFAPRVRALDFGPNEPAPAPPNTEEA